MTYRDHCVTGGKNCRRYREGVVAAPIEYVEAYQKIKTTRDPSSTRKEGVDDYGISLRQPMQPVGRSNPYSVHP